ncbi:MAG: hypothetical protein GEU87_10645 [Alphaproteobacteria bacterium]|nr:hypothetical protein [Alphaproteobacteria bacterium]
MSETVVAEFSALAGRDPADRLPPEAAEKLQVLRDAREQAGTLVRAESTRVHEARQEWQRARSHVVELEKAYAAGSMMRTTRIREPRGDGLDDLELHPKERVLVEKISIDPDHQRLAVERSKVNRLKAALDRRQAELARQQEAMNTLGALLNACEEYLRRLPRRAVVELDDGGSTKAPKGDVAAAVEHARETLRSILEEIIDVVSAPRPSSEVKAALAQRIATMGRAPGVDSFMTGSGGIDLPTKRVQNLSAIMSDGSAGVCAGSIDDTAGLLFWLCRGQLTERLNDLVDEIVEDDCALSTEERAERLAGLKARALEVQRNEVALLEMASATGAAMLPRPDTDPRAYLGLSGDLPEPKA